MDLLEKNWKNIQNRVILPLWNGKFKKMYEGAKLDYDDFESLAGFELTKAMATFNPEKSNLYTYATRVISKKAMTELRDCTRRDKRRALHTAESLDSYVFEGSTKTLGEDIQYDDGKNETSELSELRVGSFVNSLNNNQLRVLILTLLEFDISDMPNMLNIPSKVTMEIVHSLRDTDLTRVLHRRKF